MQSQITVRLSEDLDRDISALAKKLQFRRSDIVRMALQRFLEEFLGKEDEIPYNKVKDLLGSISSGISDLGESHRNHLLNKFKKHA